MKVCLGLDKTTPSLTIPIPNLLALPSNPMTVGIAEAWDEF